MKNSSFHSLRVPDDWLGFVWYLARENIKRQYTRTRLGPIWIVLTQFVMIIGIGLVFFTIFNRPFDEFLLFISASILSWNLISVTVTTAPTVFVANGPLIQSFRLPAAIFPMQTMLNSLIVFLHGLVVHVALMLIMGVSLAMLPLLLASLVVITAILYPAIAVLAILGSRFRDLGPAVGSVMYMAFLITPIIWERISISGKMVWIVDLNPFYHMIEILRRPMLGTLPSTTSVVATLIMAACSMIVCEVFFRRFSRPLPFWT